MASPYFAGPKPTNPLQSPAAADLTKAATKVAAPPEPVPVQKVVNVRAHTRTLTVTPKAPPDTNTATVRPARVSTALRFKPNYPGEPVAGRTGAERAGIFGRPANAVIPYYTDAYTTAHGQGPAGLESTQQNAAQVAAAKRVQAQNYGTPGVILRSLLPGGLNEGGINANNAVSRIANVTSMALPGGGVGEAAGLFGFGLRALRGGRAVKDVAEVTPRVARVVSAQHLRVPASLLEPINQTNPAEKLFYVKGGSRANLEQQIVSDKTIKSPITVAYDPVRKEAVIADGHHRLAIASKYGLDVPIKVEIADLSHPYSAAAPKGIPVTSELASALEHARTLPGERTGPRGKVVKADVASHHTASLPPEQQVRQALPGAKVARVQQEAGYSTERGKRFAAAAVHLNNQELPPAERIALAKNELRGELPKINFQGFKELNDESLAALQTHVLNHPHLMEGQKIRAVDALSNALAGKVPTRSEITLLEHIFGKETTNGIASIATHPYKDTLLNVLNVPRSLMASFDLSAPFRQGLMVATRHPVVFARNFGPMVKAFGSEAVYHAMLDEIRARPTYPMMLEARLPITELASDIGAREEQFKSDFAEKLTGGKYGPVRASGRAYTGFLDKTRADVFDHLIQRAQAQGRNVQDEKFLRSLGTYIGSATGRGDLGRFQPAAEVLNTFFFSPRLLASRLNFLNPHYYYKLDPFVRREALRSAFQLAGTLSTLLALASQVKGVRVQTDPRNPDWGKIRIGNTRIDIAGGFQQELRLLAQIATGVAISSTTGKKTSLTAGGFGKPTRLDIAQRFFMGKESPIASLVTDWARGSNQIGQKFNWKDAATQRMIPLLAQDSYDLYKEQHGGMNGIAAAFAGYGVGAFGVGMQTYGPVKPKAAASAPASYFGGSGSGGGSPYFPSSAGSGGGGYFGR